LSAAPAKRRANADARRVHGGPAASSNDAESALMGRMLARREALREGTTGYPADPLLAGRKQGESPLQSWAFVQKRY